jgi:pimeloyl-ACP methyl ester carboxylesterase
MVDVAGTGVAYELIGSAGGPGRPWIITPGGRFSKDSPGVRPLAEQLAAEGHQVVIWDRPNTGESDVCFAGESESEMQADALAGLVEALGLGPALIVGGSGGARVSLLAAARHPDQAAGLAMWWISGGVYGLLTLAMTYGFESFRAAWVTGMEAVVDLPEWQEVIERNPANRDRILGQDRDTFTATMERWMAVYCPVQGMTVPGLADAAYAALTLPALVFRSGASDPHHRRVTSEAVAGLLPNAELVEPPWGDREWIERMAAAQAGQGLFARWPLLAPQLLAFAAGLPSSS